MCRVAEACEMKYIPIKYKHGYYMVGIPETATEEPPNIEGKIIVELDEKIKKLEFESVPGETVSIPAVGGVAK